MEQLDSSTKHELSRLGYTFARNISVSHLVRTLLKDVNKLQNVSEDLNQLSRRNNDLSLAAMLYKTQLEEREAEVKVLGKRYNEEKAAFEEQIKILEEMLPKTVELPKSNILQVLGVSELNREALDLIRYADAKLHELENSNRTLMTQLDKNLMNSGVLINKIKLRDAEIQRLAQLVNSGSCSLHSGSGAFNTRNKHLREENARLQSEIDRLRHFGEEELPPGNDFKAELARAVDERRELARQLDHYTSKVTALQNLLHKYEHELKMARLERDSALALDRSNSAGAVSGEQVRKNVQDENGNVTNYGVTTVADQRREKANGRPNDDAAADSAVQNDKLAVYEKKISKLLRDLSVLQDAVTKKDVEITQLRGEVAIVGVAHEENLRLRTEVTSLRKAAAEFRNEIRELRQHVKQFAANAARAADAAAGDALTTAAKLRQCPREEPEEEEEEEALPQFVDRTSSRTANIATGEDRSRSRPKNQPPQQSASASLEAPALLEKVALLECEMRRLQAQAALDIENRLRTETRLREMEQNPPKKFKGLLKIDGGLMRTEFEMRDDSTD